MIFFSGDAPKGVPVSDGTIDFPVTGENVLYLENDARLLGGRLATPPHDWIQILSPVLSGFTPIPNSDRYDRFRIDQYSGQVNVLRKTLDLSNDDTLTLATLSETKVSFPHRLKDNSLRVITPTNFSNIFELVCSWTNTPKSVVLQLQGLLTGNINDHYIYPSPFINRLLLLELTSAFQFTPLNVNHYDGQLTFASP